MKIISVDNFNREGISDSLIAESVHPFYEDGIIEFLNEKFGGDRSPRFFKLVKDDHKLHVFEP